MSTQRKDEVDIVEFLQSLWMRKYLVLLVTVLSVAVALIIALTATPQYRASVVVMRSAEDGLSGVASLANQIGGLGRLAGISVDQGGPGQEAQAVLESRWLAETFVQRNKLLDEFSSDDIEAVTLWHVVEQFRQAVISITAGESPGVSTVAIVWPDPIVAARWANEYVALANELLRERALEESSRNIEYLNRQVSKTNVVELQRVMYNLIEVETKKLMLAHARDEYAFTVVDPAVAPEVRSSPKRKLIVVSGGALGVFGGIFAVFLVNVFRQLRDEMPRESESSGDDFSRMRS